MNPLDLQLPQGEGATRVRWLGTAGFAITHGEHTVLIDPYLTRAPLLRCVTSALAPDEALLERHLPRADAIVLGHTHFDHALDAPSIAKRTGARVFGSSSARALCAAHGITRFEEPREAEVGPFRLRFFGSAHSAFAFGRVPFPGEIVDCDQVPMRASKYRCGAVFGVEILVGEKRIVHLGSAELTDARTDPADLLLLCTAGWQSSKDFPERAARAFSPGTVLLSHWDDFFRPLDKPARMLPAMQMPRLHDRLRASLRTVEVGTLPLLGELRI